MPRKGSNKLQEASSTLPLIVPDAVSPVVHTPTPKSGSFNSDTLKSGTPKKDSGFSRTTDSLEEIAKADKDFLLACVLNPHDTFVVDIPKVAAALGFTNMRSVGNKISLINKKYGLLLKGTSGSSGSPFHGDIDPTSPIMGSTPSKNRVRKSKITAARASTRRVVSKPAKTHETADQTEQNVNNADELMACKTPDLEEIVFGKVDSSEVFANSALDVEA